MSQSHEERSAGSKPAKPNKIATRRAARALAMQALYQWHMAGQSLNEIESQFRVDNNFAQVDGAYFHELFNGAARHRPEIDQAIEPLLDRPLGELDPVELSILRLSTFELMSRTDVPYRVVINEGIELAKTFGATEGHKFVNGVLDKLAPQLRAAEARKGRS